MIDVTQIVQEYLIGRGADGLAGDGCGCAVDDLFPCGGCDSCVPAKRVLQEDPNEEWFNEYIFIPLDES